MHRLLFLAASLLSASPHWSPVDPHVENGEFQWYRLTESRQEVVQLLGHPKLRADAGPDFTGWQYVIGEIGDEDYSHYLVFSKATGTLVSVARNFDPQHTVDEFFPPGETTSYSLPTPNRGAPFPVRVRRLANGVYLLAMGISRPGEPCGQIVLIRESALRVFYPALFDKIVK